MVEGTIERTTAFIDTFLEIIVSLGLQRILDISSDTYELEEKNVAQKDIRGLYKDSSHIPH